MPHKKLNLKLKKKISLDLSVKQSSNKNSKRNRVYIFTDVIAYIACILRAQVVKAVIQSDASFLFSAEEGGELDLVSVGSSRANPKDV